MLKAFSDTLRASLEGLFWQLRERLPCLKFAEQEFPGEPMVWYTNYMACSTKLGLHQDRRDIGKVGSGEHSVSGILSCHFMPSRFLRLVLWKWLIFLARITAIEHSGKHYRFIELDLYLRGDASSARHILVGSVEGRTCLGKSGVDLVVDDKCAGK